MDIPENLEGMIAGTWAKVLNTRTVLKITGIIHGKYREPEMKRLFGPGGDITHRENSIRYKFDPEKIMFSQGNHIERTRIANIDMRGEIVVDLFAGIGYFSLPAAVHAGAREVHSCEINPVSYEYLKENIRLNRAHNVIPILGDCRSVAPSGVADRIFMGYVGTTHHFLATALRSLRSEGIIHYHETCPVHRFPEQTLERLEKAADDFGKVKIKMQRLEKVKNYGPRMVHVVADVEVIRD